MSLEAVPNHTLIDMRQARRFLRALCHTKLGEAEPIIVFQCIDDAKKDRPGFTEAKAGALTNLLGYLTKQNQRGAAVFFQVCAGGRGDVHVTTPRALVIDDDLKAEHRPDLSKLPPSAVVRSSLAADGRPKMHYYWFLKEDEPLDAWLPAMQHLARTLSTDPAICKLSLVMRLPGFLHCKGAPQRTELLKCEPEQRFTIAEVLAAYPSVKANGVNGHANGTNGANSHVNGTAKKYALIDQALAGELPDPEPTKGADGRDPDDAPHTDSSLMTFQRLTAWLTRIGEPFTVRESRPRFIYLTRGCPRNREHRDAILIAGTRGGIIAKCFHESCGSNKQSWTAFKTILGGWAELKRGDHVELATRLRNELRAEYHSEIIATSSHKLAALYHYSEEDGLWTVIPIEVLEGHIMNYAGLPFGEKGTAKKLNVADVQGTLQLTKARCAQPAFFEQAPTGALFTNGFLIIKGKQLELLPHAADHRARSAYQFAYDPTATAPRWTQFLHEVFAKDKDADEKIAFLQEFFGACVLGIATRYQKSLFLTGEGSNGKSVALKVLSALFPPSLISAVRPHEMDDEYSRALLYNKRINVVSELPERELLSTGGFKAMIDGSLINGRPIREAPITFAPTAAHVFACNTLPSSRDFSEGFWRRVAVIAFNREFTEAEQDKYLTDNIIATELGGVCNWCLIGGQRVLEQGGYRQLVSSNEARGAWREQTDPVALFVKEETEYCPPIQGMITEALYQAFRIWSDENGHQRMSKVAFSQRLVRLRIGHRRGKVEGKARTTFNIRLINNYKQIAE